MVRLVSELEECGRGQRGEGVGGVFLLPREKVMVSVSGVSFRGFDSVSSTHLLDPFTHNTLLEGSGYGCDTTRTHACLSIAA